MISLQKYTSLTAPLTTSLGAALIGLAVFSTAGNTAHAAYPEKPVPLCSRWAV
jgi:hypothetical protein